MPSNGRVSRPAPSTPASTPTRKPVPSTYRSMPRRPTRRTASATCAAVMSIRAPATRPAPSSKPISRRSSPAPTGVPTARAWPQPTAACARCCVPATTWSFPTTRMAEHSGSSTRCSANGASPTRPRPSMTSRPYAPRSDPTPNSSGSRRRQTRCSTSVTSRLWPASPMRLTLVWSSTTRSRRPTSSSR